MLEDVSPIKHSPGYKAMLQLEHAHLFHYWHSSSSYTLCSLAQTYCIYCWWDITEVTVYLIVSNPSLWAFVVIYGKILIRGYKTVIRIHGTGCHW